MTPQYHYGPRERYKDVPPGCRRVPPRPAKNQGRIKGEYAILPATMNRRLYRVTVDDLEGGKHSVEVTASTLYEAVALGLAEIRGQDWAGEIPGLQQLAELKRWGAPRNHAATSHPPNSRTGS